jgi:hypothetical protein
MLTKADIELIQETRKEIEQNRTVPVTLYKKVPIGENPFTGVMDYDVEDVPAECVWKPYISMSPGTEDRVIVEGVVAEAGDAFATFDLSYDLDGVDKLKHGPSGEEWAVKGIDKIGLGEPNRYYVLLGKVR